MPEVEKVNVWTRNFKDWVAEANIQNPNVVTDSAIKQQRDATEKALIADNFAQKNDDASIKERPAPLKRQCEESVENSSPKVKKHDIAESSSGPPKDETTDNQLPPARDKTILRRWKRQPMSKEAADKTIMEMQN